MTSSTRRWVRRCWPIARGLVDAGLLVAVGLGALMYYLVFYRSRLIPRWLSAWGIAGAGLLVVAGVLIIFDAIAPLSIGQIVLAVPIGLQEMVLAVWLIVKGLRQVRARRRTGVSVRRMSDRGRATIRSGRRPVGRHPFATTSSPRAAP